MGNGYIRQSSIEIVDGELIEAADLNAEFNALEDFANGTTGHTHDGTTGEGPKISLGTSVSGVLQVVNGGTGGINKIDATTSPTSTDDASDGYGIGSFWVDTTNGILYICLDNTVSNAVWERYQPYHANLTALAGLTSAADKGIQFSGSGTAATYTLTSFARTILDDTDAAAVRTTISAQPLDTELTALASTTSAADKLPYYTGSGTATTTTFTPAGRALVDDASASDQLTTLGVSNYIKTLLDDSDASAARTTLGAQVSGSYQPLDSTLTSLASFNTNGLIVQTSTDTFTGRTLTGTAGEITVSNGNGVSGNPTISIPISVTFTGKTITGGTFNSSIMNSVDINSGSITGITDLAIADGGTGSSTASGARTNLGLGGAAILNVGTTSSTVAAGDDSRITGALQRSGGTMTGKIILDGNPVSNLHAATKQYVDSEIDSATDSYTSSELTITSAGSFNLSHGLGVQPSHIQTSLICKTAEGGYSVGDEVYFQSGVAYFNGASGHSVYADSSNIYGRMSSYAKSYVIIHKTTGAYFEITNTNWKLIVRGFK